MTAPWIVPLVLATGAVLSPVATGQDRKPNIVLIMADDIGTECFASYGGTSYRTPHLDRLAEHGMKFEHCHSQPLCTPSRVKIMTGLSNVRNYAAFSILDRKQRTFAHVLGEAGYATAIAGKWQLYGANHYPEKTRGAGMHPRDSGFDHYCLWQIEKLGSRYWGPSVSTDGKFEVSPPERYGPDISCEFLMKFMEEHREKPFFAYFPMSLVHSPFVPTPASKDVPHDKKGPENFSDMVTYMDTIVGRLVDKVAELGLAEDTLFLFTSDNGTHKRIRSKRGEDVVRGGKGQTTDLGTHVPLIAYWPTHIKGKTTCGDLIDFSDFLPTLAALAGASIAEKPPLDGRSFLPQLLGKPGNARDWLYCYYYPRPLSRPKWTPKRFARDKRWKLYGNGDLFDVRADRLEKAAISEENASDEAKAARKKLAKVLASMPSTGAMAGKLR